MARDQGVELDELNFDGSDIEKGVINEGTNDAIVLEFMEKCRKDIRGLPRVFATKMGENDKSPVALLLTV